NGVKVATEENFLFSYNITSLNAAIRKALNRERTNVGRTAYTERVKSILLSSSSINVAQSLADDLQNYSGGNHHDELSWLAVQEHAVKILNQNQKVVFVTSEEMMLKPNLIDEARSSGYKIIAVPDNLKTKIQGVEDFEGNTVTDLSHFVTLYNESFEFEFVDTHNLTNSEKNVYQFTEQIFELAGGKPKAVRAVKISETMRKEFYTNHETQGIWEPSTGSIIIKRSQLSNLANYAGTLLHEAIHAKSGFGDVSRDFETELTKLIGVICVKAVQKPAQKSERPSFFKRLF
ncbi:MAG: ATP-binding protein, partial [Pseudomonadota bacterium]